MKKAAFDSSAFLAVLNVEAGREKALKLLSGQTNEPLVSAVNLSEAHAVLVRRGIPDDEAWRLLTAFEVMIVAFDEEQARIAGGLIAQTKKFGLSFGDRACLALALQENCCVVTADRAWKSLKVGVQVELVRGSKEE